MTSASPNSATGMPCVVQRHECECLRRSATNNVVDRYKEIEFVFQSSWNLAAVGTKTIDSFWVNICRSTKRPHSITETAPWTCGCDSFDQVHSESEAWLLLKITKAEQCFLQGVVY